MKRGQRVTPRHDAAYKRLFSHPTLVGELLRGFLPGDWIARLDLSSLEKIANSFISDDLRERHSDVIWRVKLRGDGDRWLYLYLLLEFQSTSDPFMAVRLMTYVSLLLEDIIRKEGLKPGDRLPAVLPLVLHNGKSRWRAPLRLESLFVPVPKEVRRHLPRLTYFLLDERRLDLGRPELEQNPAAALFRFETNESPETLPGLYQNLRDILPPGDTALRRTIDTWIVSVVRRTFPEAIIPDGVTREEVPMLEETLIRYRDQLREQFRREADEARREALLEGRRQVLIEQMALRFGRLPEKVRSQVKQITSAQELRKLTRKILRAKSLQEMGFE